MKIGHEIAKLRAQKNISQRELASALNVSAGVVGLWETDKRLPSYECLIALADYFLISIDSLMEQDRKHPYTEYKTESYPKETQKIIYTYLLLNEDNRDILIGEAKKLLKQQRLEEKRESSLPIAK